ncbi:MAG: hypothetical protein ACLQG5_06955 [Methanobacterium sp.]
MREKGAEVETYYSNELKIDPFQGPCQGDITFMGTAGKFFQDDDMEWLLPKVVNPIILYLPHRFIVGVTGHMKMFIDILSPMRCLSREIRDNRIRHPHRNGWTHLLRFFLRYLKILFYDNIYHSVC